ncbi:hypothetical protein M885DRAFT_519902 [Pelagophyceae sp. CCMP2097]|nr:hypothetical protein M885DRAFT_519902 [Pelagophyceae sp. CCMP2097]
MWAAALLLGPAPAGALRGTGGAAHAVHGRRGQQMPRIRESSTALQALLFDPQVFEHLLVAHPIATKAFSAAVVVMAGDAVSQMTVSAEKRADDADLFEYDSKRTISFGIFGALYTGCFQHWWFLYLNAHVSLDPPLLNAVAKASLCQGVTIPLLYLPLIFLITGAVRGLSIEDSFARAKASYLPLFLRNGRFWWPTQVVQFLWVPSDWQVPFCIFAGFFWSVLLTRQIGPIEKTTPVRSAVARPPLQPPPQFFVTTEIEAGRADDRVPLEGGRRRRAAAD